ncbi:MAG: hypothetical protein IJF90_13035 [Synergistaceae bacterium]|nr:hypothetical protein [Synergistaceae bacterium]
MTTWRDWELSTAWSTNGLCPDCGQTLIITELICGALVDGGSDMHNGICANCRKQYTILTDAGTLTVNVDATLEQDRIAALEDRVAKLEAIVQKLLDSPRYPDTPKPSNVPQAPQEDVPPLLEKYRYLLG